MEREEVIIMIAMLASVADVSRLLGLRLVQGIEVQKRNHSTGLISNNEAAGTRKEPPCVQPKQGHVTFLSWKATAGN